MILAPEGDIDAISVPKELASPGIRFIRESLLSDGKPGGDFLVSLREFEPDYIRKVLAATRNNKTQAPKSSSMHLTPLLCRLKRETALS